MRRLVLMLCILSVTASLVAPASAGSRKRVVEAAYSSPALGAYTPAAHAWYYDCENGIRCALITVEQGDRTVKLEVVDATGRPVRAEVYTMPGGNYYFNFCGSADKSLPVSPGSELLVHVIGGTCPDDSTVSSPTNGSVRATFTRRR